MGILSVNFSYNRSNEFNIKGAVGNYKQKEMIFLMKTGIAAQYSAKHRRRSNLSDLIWAACWISISVVIALFLADRGIAEMRTSAGFWTGIGQITGLIGTDLLLIQLILASRLPWIDKSLGHDRAMEVHKQLGKPVLILLMLHAATLTVGYGLSDKLSFIPEALSMLQTVPDMLTAILGLGLIFAIVISSLVIVRRKLDYDVWFIIHLTAYVAVMASIPHQFSAGGMFEVGTLARWYWITLYVIAGGSIAIFRFFKPLVSSIRHSIVVTEIRKEADNVITLTVTGKDIHLLKAKGGQFFIWRFLEPGLWWHSHPFSLSASPTSDSLRITIRALGHGSEKIQNIKVGTRVLLEGPYGIFTEESRTSNNIVLVAAGIGITPIRALLEEAQFQPGQATVIIRKTQHDNYLLDEVRDLAERRGATLHVLSGKRSQDETLWTPDNPFQGRKDLSSIVPNLIDSDLYVCGPSSWSRLVVKDAEKSGLSRHQIHWERFNW